MNKPDYSISRIFKITSPSTPKIYFGCTISQLWSRKYLYKMEYKNFKEGFGKKMPYFQIICNDNFVIELIEIYECKCKAQLKIRLQHWIDRNDCINEKSKINNVVLVAPPTRIIEYKLFKKTADGIVLSICSSSSSSSDESYESE